ncbi:MAG: sigma-70 family RNA polymerase sigma factor [Bacillaceae bacterium]
MKPATFERTIEQYDRLIKALMSKLHLYQNHDEFYQIGLIGLWKAYETFDTKKGSPFSSYAYQTIYYELLNHLKKDHLHQERTTYLDTTIAETIPEKEQDLLEPLMFQQSIQSLSTREQLIITERFQNGLTFKEIATKHHIHFENVRSIYRNSLKKLKQTHQLQRC